MSGRRPQSAPVRVLTVLYDADCPLCRWVRARLEPAPQLVPLAWVPCDSAEARARFPWLQHERTLEEVTVVADTGAVWTGGDAWIACLWATAAHRGLAERLSSPQLRGYARSAALTVAARQGRSMPPPSCPPPEGGYGAVCVVS